MPKDLFETFVCFAIVSHMSPPVPGAGSKKGIFSRATPPTLALERGPFLGQGWGGSPRKNIVFEDSTGAARCGLVESTKIPVNRGYY